LMDVCFILSIPLRDMYLESHPEILNNVWNSEILRL
jgi:hypothetical protein